jgi:hypothetical protein
MTRAVSSTVQLAGGAEGNAKPGREGIITSNATAVPSERVEFFVRFVTMGRNSRKEPGQPWKRTSGIAPGMLDLSWIKWISSPSIVVLNWSKLYAQVSQLTGWICHVFCTR